MPMLSSADRRACRRSLAEGSKSFFAASLLLPPRLRGPATVLYAFCRAADDAVDGSADPAAAVADLRRRLDRIYAGRPAACPVERLFADLVETIDLPRALPEALIEGFAWDADGRRYADLAALEAYAFRVAGVVGMMMSVLMGRRSEAALARAADLGIAMQYTNIARDVGEDARAGRLYLPLDWLAAEGLDGPALLMAPTPSLGLARVVARLLAAAESHYARAEAGIALLPPDCRPAIHAARLVYREIGHCLAAAGHDSISARTVVPGRRKLVLMADAVAAALLSGSTPRAEAAPDSARDLVARLAAERPGPAAARPGSAARLIEILTIQEERRRASRRPMPVRVGVRS